MNATLLQLGAGAKQKSAIGRDILIPGSLSNESRASVAAQLGIDVGAFGPQADEFWKMLDDMHAKDPGAYDQFIKGQMAEAAQEEERRRTPSFLPVPSFAIEATVRTSASKFTPSPGAAITLANAQKGSSIFINLTSHKAIEPPIDRAGVPVHEKGTRVSGDGLQIPLVVGTAREVKDRGGGIAVDVVVHPWVMECCKESKGFTQQVVELALRWVEDESDSGGSNGLKLARNWKVLEGVHYVGGLGDNGCDPVPFPVEGAERQNVPPDQRDSLEKGSKGDAPLDLSDPTALLSVLDASHAGDDSSIPHMDLKLPTTVVSPRAKKSNTSKAPGGSNVTSSGRPLVEEIQEKKSRKPAVKKGFLQNDNIKSKGLQLYPEGGSSEGTAEGPGVVMERLKSKCKVIDQNSMSPRDFEAAMKQHAGVPSTVAPHSTASGKKTTENTNSTNDNSTRKSDNEQIHAQKQASRRDPAFDLLAEAADPDLKGSSVMSSHDDGAEDILASLAQRLGGTDWLKSNVVGDKKLTPSHEKSVIEGNLLKKVVPDRNEKSAVGEAHASHELSAVAGLDSTSVISQQNDEGLDVMEHSVEIKEETIVVTVKLGEAASRPELTQLDVSSSAVKLCVPGRRMLTLQLPKLISTAATKAKFSAKKGELRITLQGI